MVNVDCVVFVPTFNQESTIEKCIANIVSQKTKYNFQIVIIDDCSEDNTLRKVEKFKKYQNIYIYKGNRNTKSFLWTKAYEEFKSDYFMICEGDDYWTSETMIENSLNFLKKNPEYVGCSRYTKMLDKNKKLIEVIPDQKKNIENFTLNDYLDQKLYVHTSSMCWKRVFKNKLPKIFFFSKLAGDVFLNCLHLQFGKMKVLNEEGSVYNVTENGMATSNSDSDNFYLQIIYFNQIYYLMKIKNMYFQAKTLRLIWFYKKNFKKKLPLLLIFLIIFIVLRLNFLKPMIYLIKAKSFPYYNYFKLKNIRTYSYNLSEMNKSV